MATPALARDAYESDKDIADVEEPPFRPAFVEVDMDAIDAAIAIAIPRVSTEELGVHIHLDDGWHRLHASMVKTACGQPANLRLALEAPRARRLVEHPLAGCLCWTPDERQEADDYWRAKFGVDFK